MAPPWTASHVLLSRKTSHQPLLSGMSPSPGRRVPHVLTTTCSTLFSRSFPRNAAQKKCCVFQSDKHARASQLNVVYALLIVWCWACLTCTWASTDDHTSAAVPCPLNCSCPIGSRGLYTVNCTSAGLQGFPSRHSLPSPHTVSALWVCVFVIMHGSCKALEISTLNIISLSPKVKMVYPGCQYL